MNDHCDKLDAYLAKVLTADDAEAFASHLQDCAVCSEAVNEQRWIDGLLVASKAAPSEAPPQSVSKSVRTSIVRRNRRNMSITWWSAVAAAIIVSLGWKVLYRQLLNPRPGAVQLVGAVDSGSSDGTSTQATFVASSRAIAVPLASRHPDVTVVRVFPTYRPPFDTTASTQPNAVYEQSWQRLSNGG
jgi:anti-sigma factor RsiW